MATEPTAGLEALIPKLRRCRVAVIGDVMLDRYVKGRANRLSPEAPIQVLDVEEDYQRPGGAANVAMKAVGLESRVRVVGLVGNDPAGGAELRASSPGIPTSGDLLISDPGRSTTEKTRFIAHNQQLLRVDREHPGGALQGRSATASPRPPDRRRPRPTR